MREKEVTNRTEEDFKKKLKSLVIEAYQNGLNDGYYIAIEEIQERGTHDRT